MSSQEVNVADLGRALMERGLSPFSVWNPSLRDFVLALGIPEGIRAWERPTAEDLRRRDAFFNRPA